MFPSFGPQPPSFNQNPIMGQLPMFGGYANQPGQMQPLLGQGLQMPQQQQPQQHQGGPLGQFGPMFGLAGMMAGHGGFGAIAPLLGGLMGWGLHKAKVF